MNHRRSGYDINFQKICVIKSVKAVQTNVFANNRKLQEKTRCTRGVRVVFSVTRMRSNNSARINKSDFTTEKIV